MPCYKRLPQLNYRNHMKMVIIDGKSVYSGGMNMGQEYIDGGPRFDVWRDTSFRLSGPVVAPYLMLFASTWLYNGGKEDLATEFMPPAAEHHRHEGIPVQVLHSSVQTTFKTIRDVFITALTNARERIWIQSPYFVPGRAADHRHVRRRGERHRRALHDDRHAGQEDPVLRGARLLPEAARAGVKVYQYKAGFLHAKTVTVDDHLSIIGTCNWDIRSLILHDEVVSIFYDRGVATNYGDQYERDIQDCVEITDADLAKLTRSEKFRNSCYRLFSRLL